ncbi:MAG: class I SAM-dependent DNA methyltransferase [Candidatus Thorarchaeota archaeon]
MKAPWIENLIQELYLVTSSVQQSQADQFKRIIQGELNDLDGVSFKKGTHKILNDLISLLKQEMPSPSIKKIEREIVFRASMNFLSKQILSMMIQRVKNANNFQFVLPKTNYDFLIPSQETRIQINNFFEKYELDTLDYNQIGIIYQEILSLCDHQHSLGAFYTPKPTVQYMISKLELDSKSIIFDPACGNGNFLEECIKSLKKKYLEAGFDALNAIQRVTSQVWGNDIDPYAVLLSTLRLISLSLQNQSLKKNNICNYDALELENWKLCTSSKEIDCIIGNPPYGISPSIERKKLYKRIYRDEERVYGYKLGGNDLFGFFLANAIKNIDNGGRICFIGTDTFLSLRSHTTLRRLILDTCKINEVLLAPIDLFRPKTTSRTCIITLTKQLCEKGYYSTRNNPEKLNKSHCSCESCTGRRENRIRVVDRLPNQSDYLNPPSNKIQFINQIDYYHIHGYPFWINIPPKFIEIMKLANQLPPHNIQGEWKAEELRNHLSGGEGISTGNNPSHLVIIENSKLWKELMKKSSRKLRSFRILSEDRIHDLSSCDEDTLKYYQYNGIDGDKFLVPFVRGSYQAFWGSEGWYIDWSSSSVNEIKNRAKRTKGRKAVFRNPHLYFQPGIVTDAHHGILKATFIEYSIPAGNTNLIFGLDLETDFLLGYLNSKLASYLLGKIINTSLGGMSGHVTPENIKRLPILLPTKKNSKKFNELKKQVIQITRKVILKLKNDLNTDCSEEKSRIDDLIFEWFNLSEIDKNTIDNYLNQVKKERALY